MIEGALRAHGREIEDPYDNEEFCRKAAVAFGNLIVSRLRKDGGELDEEDYLLAGIFVLAVVDYTTYVTNANFETTGALALLDHYMNYQIIEPGKQSGETIILFNQLMTQGKTGLAIKVTVANFFEKAGDEQFEKIIGLYRVLRGQ